MLNSLTGTIYLPKYTTYWPYGVNVAGKKIIYSSLDNLEHHIYSFHIASSF